MVNMESEIFLPQTANVQILKKNNDPVDMQQGH